MHISYFISLSACTLFILSIRFLVSPRTARNGNILGIIGMTLILIDAFFTLSIPHLIVTLIIITAGAALGIFIAKKTSLTALPQMIAALNGLGGMAAMCVALSTILTNNQHQTNNIIGLFIGGITFSGSLIAFAKLQNLITPKPILFPLQSALNIFLFISLIGLGLCYISSPNHLTLLTLSFGILILGLLLVLPVGGADMPIAISLLNACSGWAAVGIGLSLQSFVLIIIGTIVGSGGSILAYIMMKSMNRSFINIFTGSFAEQTSSLSPQARIGHSGSAQDAAFIMENSAKIIIVPGYGMAVAQAQYALKTLSTILENKYFCDVKFAIHPVAGRMPGHMNVLLAEASIDYTKVFELSDINNEFSSADVAYVIGANDITNPLAKTDPTSPIYGMPILEVSKAKTVFFVKRSLATGYSGVDNPLFYEPNTIMLYGDAKEVTEKIIKALEEN